MSNGKEVKRWWINHMAMESSYESATHTWPKAEWADLVSYVSGDDHERVVAELKAEITKQTEWKEAFMSLAEGEIPLNERWKQECLYRDQTIAKQAKVIEILKACILKEDHRCGIWHAGRKAIEQAETIERGEA